MSEPKADDVPIAYNSPNERLGLILFSLYFLLYGSFIAITVYDYKIMAKEVFWGINLAVVYGMALILSAIILAVLYAYMAKPDADEATEAAEI